MSDPSDALTFHVSRTQFYGGVGTLLALIAGFGLSMRSDLSGTQKDVAQLQSDVREAKTIGNEAVAIGHMTNGRLIRIETLLEHMAKAYEKAAESASARLTKLESWRDGPQVRPQEDR